MSEYWNSTINGTQPSTCYWNPTAEKFGKTFAFCLIFLGSLAGNTLIGIIVYKTKTLRKPINFLIVNMAMSDLLFPVFRIPKAIQLLYKDSWLIGGSLGQALCKLVIFLPDISVTVSIQSLVLIAVDRFGAVVYPLRSPLISSKLCPFFILATWIVAMASNSPELVAFKIVEYPGRLACEPHWNEYFERFFSLKNYYVSMIIIFVILPLLLITVLYIIIYIKLRSQKIPGEHSVNGGLQRQQRERNVLKMAVAIVIGFAVCWLPLAIALGWILNFVGSDIWPCGLQYFSFFAIFLALTYCAINPCICLTFSRNYRMGLKTLFR